MSAMSDVKTEMVKQDSTLSKSMINTKKRNAFLELNLRLSTYNIGAFSATGSHFYDLILGKAWLSPRVSTSSNGVRVAVIDAWDGMEDEEDFLTP